MWGKRCSGSGSGVGDGGLDRAVKFLDARHGRFHPLRLYDCGLRVTREVLEIDTAVQTHRFGWALQRHRQCLQNRDDSLGRRCTRTAREQRLPQALVAHVAPVRAKADDVTRRQVRLQEFAGAA